MGEQSYWIETKIEMKYTVQIFQNMQPLNYYFTVMNQKVNMPISTEFREFLSSIYR